MFSPGFHSEAQQRLSEPACREGLRMRSSHHLAVTLRLYHSVSPAPESPALLSDKGEPRSLQLEAQDHVLKKPEAQSQAQC